MNLPNYFMADLPAGAELSPRMLEEACHTLRRNRNQYLATLSTQTLVGVLSDLAQNWLNPAFVFRKLALSEGPKVTGFSAPVLARGLDAFFSELTPESFRALLEQDLGHGLRLDGMAWTEAELKSRRAAFACAPELVAHITAGTLPSPTLSSMVLGLLTRSAQVVKCARGASLLPRLFAHSLYDAQPKLGACLELVEWRGGDLALEEVLFREADCVTATGHDETIGAIRSRLPAHKHFLGYGHRVSFGYVSGASLSRGGARQVAQRAAADVTAWDQWGCLSPHDIYVESDGWMSAEEFAETLAEELAARETIEPRGLLSPAAAGAIASRRSFYELRAAHSKETRLWSSKDSTAWTVVYETDPQFQMSCLNRFVYVKRAKNLEEVMHGAGAVRNQVSTAGVAAPDEKLPEIAAALARWGVSRVCPLGRMQQPPLTWRHDGRPALGDLVKWTDWEQ